MDLIRSGGSLIINSSFQDVAKQLPDSCADLVIADWPFNKGIVDRSTKRMISDGVKHAHRLLKKNGTFISVNYQEPNHEVWNQAQYWGFNFADCITMLRHPIKKVQFKLGYETLPVLVFCKGKLEHRTLNTECKERYANFIFSKEICEITTDFWGELRFKNGFRRKNGDKVSEAMPSSIVERLLEMYSPPKGTIVDFFGGAGTVPLVCRDLNLKCISTEILNHRFQIIKRRLSEKNQTFIQLSKILLNQAITMLETEQTYTKGDANGKQGRKRQGKSHCEEE